MFVMIRFYCRNEDYVCRNTEYVCRYVMHGYVCCVEGFVFVFRVMFVMSDYILVMRIMSCLSGYGVCLSL